MKLILAVVFVSSFAFAEDIADKLTFSVNNGSIVLPTNLHDTQTCITGGVHGPRIRLRASVKWEGQGDFLPLIIHTSFKNINLKSEYSGVVSPGKDGTESLAFMFGLSTDYIPSSHVVHTTSTCFVDHGSLPAPVKELKNSEQLEVPVKVVIAGVIRYANDSEEPIVKEISTTITYVAGSVPVP